MNIYVATTVGCTKYLQKWFDGIKLLKPHTVVISRDVDRSEALPPLQEARVIEYRSGLPWSGYEYRHVNWESDRSIAIGISMLMDDFLLTDATHFLHIDSDVILSKRAVDVLRSSFWDYVKITIPVIPRELSEEERKEWRKHIVYFNECSCFGLSRRMVVRVKEKVREIMNDPYPVDIKLHRLFGESFRKLDRGIYLDLNRVGMTHYIYGEPFCI